MTNSRRYEILLPLKFMVEACPPKAAPLPSAGTISNSARASVTMYRVLLERAAEKDLGEIDDQPHVLRVNRVRHRREVYR